MSSTMIVAALLIGSGALAAAAPNQSSPQMPLFFVGNQGQTDRSVRYLGVGPEFKAWFGKTGVTLHHGQTVVSFSFERGPGAGNVRIDALDPVRAKANYLIGNNPSQWHQDLPTFNAIRYRGVWQGIDLTYRAAGPRLKAEYLAAPGADISRIRLRINGRTEIRADGSLLIHGATGDFAEEAPLLYQIRDGQRKQIAGGFEKRADGRIGFWTGDYDPDRPLVIDPEILISGYFGGSSEDNITALAVDAQNNIVVAGWTSSTNLPASGGAQKKYAGSVDAFVASFQPNGGGLNYCTYLGGTGDDQANGLAIDSARNVYITGWTSSTNFPVVGALRTHLGGTRDAFVTKLAAAGNALVYSTYLGGSGVDAGNAIALYTGNVAVVVGDTTSIDFPVTSGTFQPSAGGSQDAFVSMISSAGNALTFSTYFGGNGIDHAAAVAANPNAGVVVGGYTWSTNFPVVGAFQPQSGGGEDGFVAKFNPNKAKLVWSTYLGGSGGSVAAPEEVTAVAFDSSTNTVVAGTTSSTNFPVTAGAFQTTLHGETDGFIARFATLSGAMEEATYLGGATSDSINALALDFYGDIYVAGSTTSADFPIQWPFQAASGGALDAFVAKLNCSLSTLMFSSYLGGSGSDTANAIAVDAETSIILAGQTGSGNFPVTESGLGKYMPSFLTSFITKIRPNFTLGVAYPNAGQMEFTADPWHVMTDTASTFYGLSTDLPVVGDWTGTGVKRIGIFRNGTWILDTNGDGVLDAGDQTVVWGQAGDIPVVGDWRGTGHIALGLYRHGTFILDYSGHLSGVATGLSDVTYTNFGLPTDIPIAADWSGTGTSKVGVFRNGSWLVDYNGVGAISQTWTYGEAGDVPVVGDWDSSGNPPKIGVYRSGLWILDYNGDHVLTTPGLTEMLLGFGFGGYTPLVF